MNWCPRRIVHRSPSRSLWYWWNWLNHTMVHPLLKPIFFFFLFFVYILLLLFFVFWPTSIFFLKKGKKSLHWHQVLYQSMLHFHPWFKTVESWIIYITLTNKCFTKTEFAHCLVFGNLNCFKYEWWRVDCKK